MRAGVEYQDIIKEESEISLSMSISLTKMQKKTKLFKDLKSITKLLSPYVIIMKPFILALLLLGQIK